MSKRTLLVTGGTGFVGSYLTALLRREQPEARVIATSQHPAPSADGVEVVALDLTDADALAALLRQTHPDEIYHLASIASLGTGFSEPARVLANNFTLTLNLLEAARQESPTSRILLVSSADLYDHTDPAPIDETRPLRPLSPYAVSKASQDLLGQAYAASYGLPVVIVRPFNHIGPKQRPGFVVADFASAVVRGEFDPNAREIRVGNLEAARDFTDVRDMVRAYTLLMAQGEPGAVYNAGSGQAVKISDLLDMIIGLSNAPITVSVDPEKFRPVDHPLIVADARKLRQLGWAPTIPLEQTLAEIMADWRTRLAGEYQKENV